MIGARIGNLIGGVHIVKYWAFRCECDCQWSCLVSIDEMAVPAGFEGQCWITGERVIWRLEEVQE